MQRERYSGERPQRRSAESDTHHKPPLGPAQRDRPETGSKMAENLPLSQCDPDRSQRMVGKRKGSSTAIPLTRTYSARFRGSGHIARIENDRLAARPHVSSGVDCILCRCCALS
jgi:hypothetical protein